MGAQSFYTHAHGDDADAAFFNACEDARREYGHQQGYSGEINSVRAGFNVVQPPAGVDPDDWCDAVMAAGPIYDDDPDARRDAWVEETGLTAAHYTEARKQNRQVVGKDKPCGCLDLGDGRYLFFGLAPC